MESLQFALVVGILCWCRVATSCTPWFLESWSLPGCARTRKSPLLSSSVYLVQLAYRATDLAFGARWKCISSHGPGHEQIWPAAAVRVCKCQPLPILTATWQLMAVVTSLLGDTCVERRQRSSLNCSHPLLESPSYPFFKADHMNYERIYLLDKQLCENSFFAVGINNFIWEM